MTHLSVDRLERLRVLCSIWQGPLAASVWLQPTLTCNQRKAAICNIEELVLQTRSNRNLFRCDLHLVIAENQFTEGPWGSIRNHLCTSEMADATSSHPRGVPYRVIPARSSPLSPLLYPVNALRGAAVDIVTEIQQKGDRTLIFVVDVDMRPPDLLCRLLSSQSKDASRMRGVALRLQKDCIEDGHFVVVRALECCATSRSQTELKASIGGMLRSENERQLVEQMSDLCAHGELRAFHASTYPAGHAASRTGDWLRSVITDSGARSVHFLDHQEGWEPYGIMSLDNYLKIGGFNRCFVGWHRDKIEFIRRLHANKVRFVSYDDPSFFLLDWQPHDPTADRATTSMDARYKATMQGLYLRCCRQMQALEELTPEEAYRDGVEIPSLTPEREGEGDGRCEEGIRVDRLPIVFRSVSDAQHLDWEGLFKSDNRCEIHLKKEVSNILFDRKYGVVQIAMMPGDLTPPAVGVSFRIEPVGFAKLSVQRKEKESTHRLDCLGFKFAFLFPLDFEWSASVSGCLTGLYGNLSSDECMRAFVEGRIRWDDRGRVRFKFKEANHNVSILVDSRHQIQRGSWHCAEVVCSPDKMCAFVDGNLLFIAKSRSGFAFQPLGVRMCVFSCEVPSSVQTSISLRDILITGRASGAAKASEGPVCGPVENPLSPPPLPPPEITPLLHEEEEKEKEESGCDGSQLILDEVTVLFAPKETHSSAADTLRQFLIEYPRLHHLIIIVAAPVPDWSQSELLAVANGRQWDVDLKRRNYLLTVLRASPFQNPYEGEGAMSMFPLPLGLKCTH